MKICLAPMDGITDCAYRIICKHIFEQHGHPDDELMLRTEFMSADGYYHNPPGVIKHLLKTDYDHETIAQIFGGNTDTLVACAQDIDKKYDFAGIELNMGCPSPKIMKCAAGSGMLKDKKKTLSILKEISQSISVPFSLKTRTGLTIDDVEEQFDFLVEASKYVRLIAVHGRTYKQSHSGDVNRDFLYRLKERLPDKVIIGNGGIRSYQQATERCKPTNIPPVKGVDSSEWSEELSGGLSNITLDGTMIAQSAIGNPRILTPHTPSPAQRYDIIIQHLNLSVACEIYFNETIKDYTKHDKLIMPTLKQLNSISKGLPSPSLSETKTVGRGVGGEGYFNTQIGDLKSPIEFRKYLFNYISGLPNSKPLKQAIAKTRDYHGLLGLLNTYFQDILKKED